MSSLSLLENRFVNVDRRDIGMLLAALETGALAGTAPVIREYEHELESFFGVRHAIAVSSGTAALHALLLALSVGSGDEVILPAIAPVMTALPIVAAGATPVFVDIEAGSFGLDESTVRQSITERTRAVVAVPMWGYPSNVASLQAMLQQYAIPLIEDSSHAHGMQEIGGALSGTLGLASFFSTQERKLIATGEGGFVLTGDDELARGLREVRDFGKVENDTQDSPVLGGQYGHKFGMNFRLPALGAALGISQLAKLPDKIQQRAANAGRLQEFIKRMDIPYVPQAHGETGRPNFYSLVLRPVDGRPNNAIGSQLASDGVISDIFRFGGIPLNEMPIFRDKKTIETPNVRTALDTFVTLPVHEGLSDADLRRIEDAVSRAVTEAAA